MNITITASSLDELNEVLARIRIVGEAPKIAPPSGAPLSDLELSTRPHNALLNAGIVTIGQLCACTEHNLLMVPNLGRLALNEIKESLAFRGLKLA